MKTQLSKHNQIQTSSQSTTWNAPSRTSDMTSLHPPPQSHVQMLSFRSELAIKALSLDLQDLHSVPSSASDLRQVISIFSALMLYLK